MQRISALPEVKAATQSGNTVIACVYTAWVPRAIAAQLPEDHNSASWAAEVVEGRIVRLASGPAEKVAAQLASTP